MDLPLVSCIMPTANRQKYIPFAINYFLQQDYSNKELIIIDDGIVPIKDLLPEDKAIHYFYSSEPIGTIGAKRNYACEKANGEFILHWDDDDWYASDWISRHVDAFQNTDAEITGLNKIVFYSPAHEKKWIYVDDEPDKPWLAGATLGYRKKFWHDHPFIDLQVGEDYDFVWNSKGKTHAIDYMEGFTALLHPHNTSIKPIENPKHKKNPTHWVEPKESEKS